MNRRRPWRKPGRGRRRLVRADFRDSDPAGKQQVNISIAAQREGGSGQQRPPSFFTGMYEYVFAIKPIALEQVGKMYVKYKYVKGMIYIMHNKQRAILCIWSH